MEGLFKRARDLEGQVTQFFNQIFEAALTFQSGLDDYLAGDVERMGDRLRAIKETEARADDLRRDVRFKLYSRMLIPESRGDVLGLLESSDSVVDASKRVLSRIETERPEFRANAVSLVKRLCAACTAAMNGTANACHAYITNKGDVEEHIHKVYFYEHEADEIEEDLKRMFFADEDIPRLSERMLLRDTVAAIAEISDIAQAVAERVSISAIKRSI